MTPIETLAKIVRDQTEVYRKGEVVSTKHVPAGERSIEVTTIDAFPETPDRGVLVDTHFVQVGFTEAAADERAFLEAREKAMADHGEFCDISAERMAEGPSYIEIGGWIGDQTLALQFMALSQHHGVGEVITPERMHLPEEAWDEMAGRGMVLLAPKRREPE